MSGRESGRGLPHILYQCATNNDFDQPVTVIVHEILSAHKKCLKKINVAKI